MAVLGMLASIPPDFAEFDTTLHDYDIEISTYPWNNGRERGVALVVERHVAATECLVITFAENKASDDIVVDYWVQGHKMRNGPHHTLVAQNYPSWDKNRKEFPRGRVDLVVDYIQEVMERYYTSKASPAPSLKLV